MVSSLVHPSHDQVHEAGERALAPGGASHLAPRVLGLQHHGFHSRQQSALDLGTCTIDTCGWEEFLSFQESLGVGMEAHHALKE